MGETMNEERKEKTKENMKEGTKEGMKGRMKEGIKEGMKEEMKEGTKTNDKTTASKTPPVDNRGILKKKNALKHSKSLKVECLQRTREGGEKEKASGDSKGRKEALENQDSSAKSDAASDAGTYVVEGGDGGEEEEEEDVKRVMDQIPYVFGLENGMDGVSENNLWTSSLKLILDCE